MTLADLVQRFSDTYERKARLYPAFLAMMPLVAVAIGLYGIALDLNETAVTLLGAGGVFYFLANVVRELGKRKEESLYVDWGGVPSTQLQRHRDTTIDPITKKQRHTFLAGKLSVRFPTAADELADPVAADHVYAAGTRWLLEQTRDVTKFGMLFKQNIEYGYRRNALGLKPIAIGICLISVAWILIEQGVISLAGFDASLLTRLTRGASLSLIVAIVMLLVWILFFTKRTVRTAAFSYADMLLRACATLG